MIKSKFVKQINPLNVIILAVTAILLLSCTGHKETKSSPPNILFIMSDDHTSQAWGIYDGILEEYVRNENIERIANDGAKLNNVFCTNSICVPSRASIMTGNYSHENGVYTLSDSLNIDKESIARLLQENGYATSIVGKWHLKEVPQGFDYVKLLPGQGRYHNPVFRTPETWNDQNKWEEIEGFSSDVIGDLSVKWLEKRDKSEPFFMMTHFKATHEPFDYPERFAGLYKNVVIPEPENLMGHPDKEFAGQQLEILGERYENSSNNIKQIKRYPGLPVEFTKQDSASRRSEIYQKFIKDFMRSGAAIDDNIGKLLDYLEKEGIAENTIVIYTSDQGYFLGEHGFFDKRMMYEEALRMPFVIRYPKHIKPKSEVDEMILNVDFAALFADYAGIGIDEFGQGKSFRKLVEGGEMADWRKEMYYRYWQHLDIRPAHLGIRSQRYKLIYFYGEPLGKSGAMNKPTKPFWEFYDLEKDPSENRNEIYNLDYSELIVEMKSRLLKLKEEVGDMETEVSLVE